MIGAYIRLANEVSWVITKVCPQCHKEFSTKYKRAKYCGKQCSNLSMMHRETKICPHCSKSFTARSGRKFCSRDCADSHRKGVRIVTPITKVCLNCGKSFEAPRKCYKFCSISCANQGKNYPTTHNLSDTERANLSQRSKLMWQNAEYRNRMVNRMITNNPVYMPGVIEKAHQTRLANGFYPNNFKYGNGKISAYEQRVGDRLIPLGFYYNYAIPTKLARDAFPGANYPKCYKPDFVHLSHKLCIEVDGCGHILKKDKQIDKKKKTVLPI